MNDRIGILRARITLQRPASMPDELGGAAASWVNAGAAWAEIEALGGSEAGAADVLVSANLLRVTLRRFDGVRAGWRVTWSGRRFRIVAVADDGGPRIALACEEEIR
jgi:SPP1 family predicted phage head-tail adaptor